MNFQANGQASGGRSFWHFLVGILVGIALLLTLLPVAQATQPPRPGEIEELKATGEFEKRKAFVKALGNDKMSPRLVRKFKEKRRAIRKKVFESRGLVVEENEVSADIGESPSGGETAPSDYLPPADQTKGLPTQGAPKIFALLISFDDYPSTVSSDTIDEMLWGGGNPSDYPRESLANYYGRSSYGHLDLRFGHTFAWYQTSYARSEVEETWEGRQALIKEALNHFNSQGHDFSQYDYDQDGDIDYFAVFWTGPDTGWGNFWWAYKTTWQNSSYTIDGKTLGVYSWQWESSRPSIVIHETGHALGLPDYYDYDGDVGPDGGVGGFDMMDANRGDHNCFSKWLLGWVEPTVIAYTDDVVTLGDTTTTDCVLVWPGIGLEDMFSEFFMVQNRQDTGNDESFDFAPDGLAIWHIDATLKQDGSYFTYNNSYSEHKLIRLMEADGLEEIENNLDADWRDLYSPTDEFSPDSFPASTKYNGFESCVRVWNIQDDGSSPGDTITATFNFACTCDDDPVPGNVIMPAVGATDISTTPFLNWTWVNGRTSYQVEVCEDIDCSVVVASAAPTANYWNVSPPLGDWKEYWWRVRTNGSCDTGDWSPAWNFTTRCEAPPVYLPERQDPADGTTDTAFDPKLFWDREAGADYYNVYVCSDPDCASVVRSGMAFPNVLYAFETWTVTPDLAPGTQYWWKIRSANKCQYSDWSSTWSFTTHDVFSAPALISPANGASYLPLSPTFQWQAVPNATHYRIKVCADADCSDVIKNYLPSETEWQCVGSLEQGTTYYWQVGAMDDGTAGPGPMSPTRAFETCVDPLPPPAASLWPATGATDISPAPTLNWDLPPGDAFPNYDVEVCTDSACETVVCSTHLSSSQWPVSPNLALNTTYYWRVRSSNACGESEWVNGSFSTTACPVPTEIPFPTYPAFGEADVSVTPTLQWTYPLYPVYHLGNVEVYSDPQCETLVRSATGAVGSSWTVIPALEPDTQYWWRVSYANACGHGLESLVTNFRTVACVVLASPTLADPGGSVDPGQSYSVSWSPVEGALAYKIEESTSTAFTRQTSVAYTVTGTSRTFSHSDSGCSGDTYYYRVKAQSDCSISEWSGIVNMDVNGTAPPHTPTVIGVSDNSTTPTLDWEDVPGADSYDVRVCDDSSCKSPVRNANTAVSQWRVSPELNVSTFWWQVRSRNNCDDLSIWSAAVEIHPGCTSPATPTISDPGNAIMPGLDYTVSWTAVADADGYRIQEADNPDFQNATTYTEGRDTFRVFSHFNTGCQPLQYYYRVVAFNDCGISRISGTVDMVINGIGIPSAPALVSPGDGASQVSTTPTLVWGDDPKADEYEVWVCRDSGCTTVVRNVVVGESAWPVTPALEEGTAYWWQIMARNPCGADVSSRRPFETVCPLPGTPVLTDPGKWVESSTPYTLNWTAIHGAGEYHIQEATNPAFTGATLYRTTATSRDFSHPNAGCTLVKYYYRVVAVNDCGQSTFSNPVDIDVNPLDTDGDDVCDLLDNCPDTPNTNQQDTDGDGVGDVCDACPFDFDGDADIDGADLAALVPDVSGASIRMVADRFGKYCP